MPNVFIISDTHFGHENILKFTNDAGEKLRDFPSVADMDEFIVSRWNSVVRPQDKVYHLGDVAMHRDCVKTIARCNGHKRLVRGNHDDFPTTMYLEFFDEIYATRLLDGMMMSHVPLHPDSINGKWRANVHGHTHNNFPQGHLGPKYYNVSIEMMDYLPISLEDLKKRLPHL